MADRSRFVLNFDRSANEVNQRPNLKGEYRLAGEDVVIQLSLWGRTSEKTGNTFARGQATPRSVSAALRTRGNAQEIEAPPGVEIKVGEVVLFENERANDENKWPKFRGYAREANRYVKLSGWEHGGSITGDAEIYTKRDADADPSLEPTVDGSTAQRPLREASGKAPTAELD